MTRKPAVKKGFTLIELMAVILILAILAGVALPRFFNYQTQAREAATKGTLGGVRAGIANFYANKAISASAAVYPTFAELTTLGTVMQESIPENPYNNQSSVSTSNAADATVPRTATSTEGWRYFNAGSGGSAAFFANTTALKYRLPMWDMGALMG